MNPQPLSPLSPPPLTLALETSTPQGSVALLERERLLFSESFQAGRGHGSRLFEVLDRALALRPGFAAEGMTVAVGLGPGSYAGVRIAISAAIGLGIASGAALVGIPSIATLGGEEESFIALGDARRESFYFAVVRGGVCATGPELLPAAGLEEKLSALAALPVYASEALPAAPRAQLRFPCAERLARLALAGRSIVQRDRLEPIYLRDPHITRPANKRVHFGPQRSKIGPV